MFYNSTVINIIHNTMEENLNFDTAMSKMEAILDDLEANSEKMSPEEVENKLKEAEALKEKCKELLRQEKEEIIKTAKENNISLEELGITEDDDFDDDEDDDEEEEEEGETEVKF